MSDNEKIVAKMLDENLSSAFRYEGCCKLLASPAQGLQEMHRYEKIWKQKRAVLRFFFLHSANTPPSLATSVTIAICAIKGALLYSTPSVALNLRERRAKEEKMTKSNSRNFFNRLLSLQTTVLFWYDKLTYKLSVLVWYAYVE